MAESGGRWAWLRRSVAGAVVGGVAAGVSLVLAGGVDFRQLPVVVGWGLMGGWVAGLVTRSLCRDRTVDWGWAVPVALVAVPLTWVSLVVLNGTNGDPNRWRSGLAAPLALTLAATVGGFWGLAWQLLVPGRRGPGAGLGMTALFVACVWSGSPLVPSLLSVPAERARELSCNSNVKQLALASLMYAQDYDDYLPPPVSSLALAGIHYERFPAARQDPWAFGKTVLGGGLIDPYAKNNSIWFCPSDHNWRDLLGRPRTDFLPSPGLSYRWNVGVAGRRTTEVPDPGRVPLLFDRHPIHSGRRNVAHVDGHVAPVPEATWRSWHINER